MSRDINFHEPLNEADEAYVAQRPWLLRDAELQGIEVSYERDVFTQEDAEEPDEPEHEDDEDDTVDYTALTKADLKRLVAERNAEREDADKVVPASDKNEDLIAALQADDELDEEEEDDEE